MSCEIYKHTSKTTNKSYIGYTTKNTSERLYQHNRLAVNGSETHFHRAIRKYGLNDFYTSILEDSLSIEQAKTQEMFWIDFYDTFHSGYNMTLGGDGFTGYIITKETIAKMRATKSKIQEDGTTIDQRSARKAAKTRGKIQEDGTSIAQKAAKEAAKTMSKPQEDGTSIREKATKKAVLTSTENQEDGTSIAQKAGKIGGITRTKIQEDGTSIAQKASADAAETMSKTQEDGTTIREKATKKAISTRTEIQKDGLSIAQKASNRAADTMNKPQEDGTTIYEKATKKGAAKIRGRISMYSKELKIYKMVDKCDVIEMQSKDWIKQAKTGKNTSTYNTIYIHKISEKTVRKRIQKDKLESFLKDDWILGYGPKDPK